MTNMYEQNAHFTFIDGTLIEACPRGGHRVFGGRGEGFCCTYLAEGECDESMLPAFARLFDEYGNALTLADNFGEGGARLTSGQAAIDRYVASIPVEIRRAAGRFDHLQFIVADAALSSCEFLDFVQTDLKSVGPGYIATCIVLIRSQLTDTLNKARLLEEIIHAPRRDVLSRFTGKPVGHSLIKALKRLDVTGLREVDIWRLVELVEDSDRKMHLAAIDQITTSLIFHLPKLPRTLISPDILKTLQKAAPVCADFDALFSKDVLGASRDVHEAILRSIKHQSESDIIERLYDWSEQLRLPVLFPVPPFPADNQLHPIKDSRQLYWEGKSMANCVTDYLEDVLHGRRYFYHWEGGERVTIELLRQMGKRWRLGQCKGFGNQDLDLRTQAKIEMHFDALTVGLDSINNSNNAAEKVSEYLFE